MKKVEKRLSARIIEILSSRRFFVCTVILLIIQALWVSLSANYPMAFDEDYHLGLIRLYAHHVIPFLSGQAPSVDVLGAAYRDPSFLYHYILSFPYRLVSMLSDNQAFQVITLRLLNIGLFSTGLFIYRKWLLAVGSTRAVAHACLLLFVLIPIVPLLAGQINYDNLFIPLTGLLLLEITLFAQELLDYRRVASRRLLYVFILCLAGSLVKYAFLPIALAAVIYITGLILYKLRSPKTIVRSFLFGLTLVKRQQRYILLLAIVLLSIFWLQRYGLNTIRYHTPVPDCAQVLNEQRCQSYGPWQRDDYLAKHKGNVQPSDKVFVHDWFKGMWLRLYFSVGGPTTNFQTRGPLLLPALSAVILVVCSCILSVIYGYGVLRKTPLLAGPLFLLLLYVAILWIDEFSAFRRTGQAVAINGRYLLSVIPILLLLFALVWQEVLYRKDTLKLSLLAAVVILQFWGGGVMTFILRSSDQWLWSNSIVRRVNYDIRRTVGPVVPGYTKPTLFL